MDELARWLGEQLDEDEEEARRGYLKADPLPDYDGWDKSTMAGLPPIVAARVLREIDAKRGILAEHSPRDGRCRVCAARAHDSWTRFRAPCATLRWLALPYADRPGYEERWAP